MKASHRKSVVIGTLIAMVVIVCVGILITPRERSPKSETVPIPGLLWPPPDKQLGNFMLKDQSGNAFNGSSLAENWSLLFFGYTHCPDICPQTLAVMSQMSPHLSKAARENLQLIFVSVDQQRDTPQELASYLSYFPSNIIGLTGDAVELTKLTRELGISYTSEPATDAGEYLVEHSSAILVIDPELRLIGIFSPPHRADDMARRYQQMREFVEKQS